MYAYLSHLARIVSPMIRTSILMRGKKIEYLNWLTYYGFVPIKRGIKQHRYPDELKEGLDQATISWSAQVTVCSRPEPSAWITAALPTLFLGANLQTCI